MPNPPKDPTRRQRPKAGKAKVVDLSLLPSRQLKAPPAPERLTEASKVAWGEFWKSDLAGFVDVPTALPALERLFELRERQEWYIRTAEENQAMVVLGSKGQIVLSPLLVAAERLEGQIVALEDRFGLTPRARAQLGARIVDVRRGLDELNASQVQTEPRPAPLDLATDD